MFIPDCRLANIYSYLYITNLYTVVTGAFINLAVILFLRLWTPNPDDAYVFFIIAAFWGISDAIWQTQINGKYF